MTAEYNAGVFFVAAVAGPLDVRVIDQRNGLAYPISVTSSAARMFNGPIESLTVQNLSASPIEVAADPGLSYGRGTRIPPRSQWTLDGGAVSIGGADIDTGVARPQWYDRNPVLVNLTDRAAMNEGQGVLTQWTYTVPAKRAAYIQHIFAQLLITTALTNVNPNGNIFMHIGGVIIAIAELGVATKGSSDKFNEGQIGFLDSGSVFDCTSSGGGAGAGQFTRTSSALIVEYDK